MSIEVTKREGPTNYVCDMPHDTKHLATHEFTTLYYRVSLCSECLAALGAAIQEVV